MQQGLTPAALDVFAERYYLNRDEVLAIDVEELAQEMAIPLIVRALGESKRVLEMGYGTGLTARTLPAAGVDLEMVEGSPTLTRVAREQHPGLIVHQAMFEEFEPTNLYDAVLCLHVLEHVDDPRQVLSVARRWLKPGGTLVAVVPNRESYHRRIAVEMGLHEHLDDLSASDHVLGHLRVYSMDLLRADIEASGFAVEEEIGYLFKTVPNSMMLSYPPEMLRALNTISSALPPRDLANIGVRACAV